MIRETCYKHDTLIAKNEPKLFLEQQAAYNTIVNMIMDLRGGVFFLYAPGGTGNILLINFLLAKVRQSTYIALAVASSGIAATLLTGGRAAHSAFKLRLNLVRTESPVCNISKILATVKVLQEMWLIVCNECTM